MSPSLLYRINYHLLTSSTFIDEIIDRHHDTRTHWARCFAFPKFDRFDSWPDIFFFSIFIFSFKFYFSRTFLSYPLGHFCPTPLGRFCPRSDRIVQCVRQISYDFAGGVGHFWHVAIFVRLRIGFSYGFV